MFGSDAVKMLREQPAEVAERLSASGAMSRLSVEDAEKIASAPRRSGIEGCTLDLMDLLTGRGFRKSTARLATREWGNRAAQIIRRNPYRLMNFPGCRLQKVRLALSGPETTARTTQAASVVRVVHARQRQ
jgi:hypothetical protein